MCGLRGKGRKGGGVDFDPNGIRHFDGFSKLPYRRDITSSQIGRLAAASGLAEEFRIVLPIKVKICSTSSVYSRLYDIRLNIFVFIRLVRTHTS